MEHKCSLNKDNHAKLEKLTWCARLRLISPYNPLGLSLFRSDISIRQEQRRHLDTNKLAIHPYSKFKAWYEIYLIYLYASVLITKPMDAAFMNSRYIQGNPPYQHYTQMTDGFCWVDIVLHFFMGYEVPNSNSIELRKSHIAMHYLFGPYFILDVVSSLPKGLIYYLPMQEWRFVVICVISITGLFKIVRLISLVSCIRRTTEYFRIAAKGMVFLLCCLVFSSVIVHWMACMQFFVPKLLRRSFPNIRREKTWYSHSVDPTLRLANTRFLQQYFHCLFRSSAYVLGIRLEIYRFMQPEEYMVAMVTYLIGKIMVAFIWIILAVSILNSRLIYIKYAEFINQLEEYMRQKQLPMNLRSRMLQYCRFKFRDRFFKEDVINGLFSESLRREADLHACRNLIQSVSIFGELSPYEMSKLVGCLVSEIYMPNDTILHTGSHGDAMYFIASGTVAVYTRSGREVCHMQDGAYFGEVSLVLKGQLRLATVVALETTHVYRLNKRDFDKCLLTNGAVKAKIMRVAETKLKETMILEEEYKQSLLQQSMKIETKSRVRSEKKRK